MALTLDKRLVDSLKSMFMSPFNMSPEVAGISEICQLFTLCGWKLQPLCYRQAPLASLWVYPNGSFYFVGLSLSIHNPTQFQQKDKLGSAL